MSDMFLDRSKSFDLFWHCAEYVATLFFENDDGTVDSGKYLDFARKPDAHFVDLVPKLADIFDFYKYSRLTKDDDKATTVGVIDSELAPYCYDRVISKNISLHKIAKNKARNAFLHLKEHGAIDGKDDRDLRRAFNSRCANQNKAKKILIFNKNNGDRYKLLKPFLKEIKYCFLCADVRFEDIGGDDIDVIDIPVEWAKCPKCYFYHGNTNCLCERCYRVEILNENEERWLF